MKHRQLSLLFFLVMFVIGTDTFLVSPLLPTLTHYYGITTSLSGFIVSAYAIGYMLSALLIGPISDRHDRKKILVGGLVVFTVATASCGLANTFAWMLITRFVAGIAAATAGPQIWAAIPVLFPRQQVVKVMGYATAGLAVAQIVGVPLGSYLAVWSWRFPFFFVERGNGNINWWAYVRHAAVPLSFMIVFYANYFLLVPRYLFQNQAKRYVVYNIILLCAIGVLLHLWQSLTFDPSFAPKPKRAGMPPGWLFFLRDMLSLVFTIGLSAAIRMSARWTQNEAARKEAEKSRAEAELKICAIS